MENADAPGDGATGSAAGGGSGSGSGDETAWLDLVARFDAPADDGSVPWPEREDLIDSVPAGPVLPDALPVEPPDSLRTEQPDAFRAEPPVNPAGLVPGFGAGHGPRDVPPAPDDPDAEHYIPPTPPPLPKLNPATKLAWLALFGGPAYLLLSTVMGWPVSGLAAFLCVAAFIGGFAALVIRMDNGGPRDSGPDDGAVV